MKTTTKSKIALTCATAVFGVTALTTFAGPPVIVVPPPIVVPAPPVAPPPVVVQPSITVGIGVPDNYVWDGDEYVGVIGDQYYYLGPNHVWLPVDTDRLARFHAWERDHHDWRNHAIENEKYRLDAQGHEHPWHGHDHDGH